jgi:6-phosphogluconolactonase (cycloisomerase 2 family)
MVVGERSRTGRVEEELEVDRRMAGRRSCVEEVEVMEKNSRKSRHGNGIERRHRHRQRKNPSCAVWSCGERKSRLVVFELEDFSLSSTRDSYHPASKPASVQRRLCFHSTTVLTYIMRNLLLILPLSFTRPSWPRLSRMKRERIQEHL